MAESYRTYRMDVLVSGSGGAAIRAAIAAKECEADVMIITKGLAAKSGATITAGADISVDSRSAHDLGLQGDTQDTKEIFFEDIVREGRYINDQRLVEVLVKEAPARLGELMDWGLPVKGLLQGPGHTYSRGVYTSGVHIMAILNKELKRRKIPIVEDHMITDLLTKDNTVVGAVGLDLRSGEFVVYQAKAVVLATGGAHKIWPDTTGPEGQTGDGMAMAYRAGAELVDMEMVQFLPTSFAWPPAWRGISWPIVIVHRINAWLLNKYGYRFMRRWDPHRMEKSTRDILSVGIMSEILADRASEHGGVYLSLAHLPKNLINYIPKWYIGARKSQRAGDKWKSHELSFQRLMDGVIERREALEVVPAVHFFMGGIRINVRCETNLRGLFAAGECTGGLHGANRLTGNAISQILVQGAIAGRSASEFAAGSNHTKVDLKHIEVLENALFKPLKRNRGVSPIKLRNKMHKIANDQVGSIREGSQLRQAIRAIERLRKKDLTHVCTIAKNFEYNKEWIEAIDLANRLLILGLIARAALIRKESRGAHYRKDYPYTDNNRWLKNIVISLAQGKSHFAAHPVPVTSLVPPEGKMAYSGGN